MHEYSIAYDLYATARKAALDNQATKVKKIRVDIGKMAMVNPDQVIFLFDTIKEDDPLFATAELACTEIEPETRCPCGYAGNEIYVCPKCGALPEVVRGREIVVTNVEIEVAD
ncbi:hydrogenase maturation nickel metallochaperone HypA [Methanoregula sp. UBA64]|jgi:hydrogenase nickel incorporation protein HypA/HybF|uniref:hydrogenase maturation nickel metallochaperone HypA/HybF n=1 Tax=Methanoregula sp. UBA64 TaxID=1915554 RepID=UPI0025F074AB|nr:hydrogenase maturation nickel metallochaperone HypA [Methanoregula sp. UBA64]